ncbi:ATP-dependent zinc metalloprotease FtsH [Thermodesulfobium sp. 4217-1]|uniref:ATP-dependent zinc metalloprotease FtsH n=1 Tax=Thermodesulfobium sp. 4217-1 TaxID=3120013 RepID=UPI003221A143
MYLKITKSVTFYLIILLIVVVLTVVLSSGKKVANQELSYTEFMDRVNQEEVRKVNISSSQNIINGKLKDGTSFTVYYPQNDPSLIKTLTDKKVDIRVEPPSDSGWWVSILTQLFPILILIGFWLFMLRQAQGGASQAMSFGKSRAKLFHQEKTKTTFKDVAGADEAKQELEEIIDFLKNPAPFRAMGAKIPRGVLLVGPPGCGKTLLARAVAGEAKVPFFSISGSDFVEMFVGVGASRVRDLFEQAKNQSPCIIFIDEIDAVGRQRGAGLGGGHDEREQTLNQLLVEMDGFEVDETIIVMAATNRPDVLDPALLRPGRFDRHVTVDRPDLLGRKQILDVHMAGKPMEAEVNVEVIAKRTPGFAGADLANLVNEAALLAARKGKKTISMAEFEDAIDRIVAGIEKRSRVISEKDKKIIAFHEAGHALVAHNLPGTDPIHKISIIPRGMALGYTLQLPGEDRYLVSKTELINNICVLLGGRAAEELVFKEVTTGAQNDLQRATELARKMIMEYGMSEHLGPRTWGKKSENVFMGRDLFETKNYSENMANEIDLEVQRMVESCYENSKNILLKVFDTLNNISAKLIENETLQGDSLMQYLNGNFEVSKAVEESKTDDESKTIETPQSVEESKTIEEPSIDNAISKNDNIEGT